MGSAEDDGTLTLDPAGAGGACSRGAHGLDSRIPAHTPAATSANDRVMMRAQSGPFDGAPSGTIGAGWGSQEARIT